MARPRVKKPATAARSPLTRIVSSPLERLKRAGKLSTHEANAADEIVYAYRTYVDATPGGDKDLRLPAHHRPDAADGMAVRRVDLLRTLYRWRTDLRGTFALVAAMSILIEEVPARRCARANKWRDTAALDHLRTAVRHYAWLTSNTPASAHGWRFVRPRGRAVGIRPEDDNKLAC